MDVTIFHNPRCSKSRAALALLQERGVAPRVVHYLETPPTGSELRAIVTALGLGARGLLRRGEPRYAELGLDDPSLSDEQLIRAMATHPVLIERPVVRCADRAVIGRPPEKVLEIL
jgi:arsenate reductase